MKIIINDKVYIHKIDIRKMMEFDHCSEFFKLQKQKKFLFELSGDAFDLLMFDDTDIINFFKSLDYLLDYDEVSSLTIVELLSFRNDNLRKMDALLTELIGFPECNLRRKMVNFYEMLRVRITWIDWYIEALQGWMSINMPENLEIQAGNVILFEDAFKYYR